MILYRKHYFISIAVTAITCNSHEASATTFKRLSLAQIYDEMDTLASNYPDFVTVTSTQDEFNLPSSCKERRQGGDNNIYTHGSLFPDEPAGCSNRYIVLQDPVIYSHRNGKKALKQRPDIFLSGALHGDERVGPVAMIEVAKLLALAAACKADRDSLSFVPPSLDDECNTFSSKYSENKSSWLAQLVSTRRIVIFPAPNSNGYHLNLRHEPYYTSSERVEELDPNRDFAFDNTSSNNCMQTIAARSINELFQKYLFQMSMTYHSGIENITYEWGAKSIPRGKISPDDIAQRTLVEKMSLYAGELNSNVKNNHYDTGDMNTVLYGVHGGFEDWAYAGSWASNLMRVCTPYTYGGYDSSKTMYDDATLATFNVLVEISYNKNPPSRKYGSDEGMLTPPFRYDNNVNNGYVTKHIRTALMAIDTVEPYVRIHGVKKRRFHSDYSPLRQLKSRWCKRGKERVVKSKGTKTAKIFWSVGGSINVNETFLIYGLWSDFPKAMNCINQVKHGVLMPIVEGATVLDGGYGSSNNSTFYKTPIQSTSSAQNLDVQQFFSQNGVDLSKFQAGDSVAVFAVAKVDQNWKDDAGNNVWPGNVQQQSHMALGRTNIDYYREKLGSNREVQGRLYWISVPITVQIR